MDRRAFIKGALALPVAAALPVPTLPQQLTPIVMGVDWSRCDMTVAYLLQMSREGLMQITGITPEEFYRKD